MNSYNEINLEYVKKLPDSYKPKKDMIRMWEQGRDKFPLPESYVNKLRQQIIEKWKKRGFDFS